MRGVVNRARSRVVLQKNHRVFLSIDRFFDHSAIDDAIPPPHARLLGWAHVAVGGEVIAINQLLRFLSCARPFMRIRIVREAQELLYFVDDGIDWHLDVLRAGRRHTHSLYCGDIPVVVT